MAEVIQDSIRLVSFASDECTKSHAHTVCDLGHRLELVQNDTWLDYHEDSPGNTIVLIENKSFVQSNLLHSSIEVAGRACIKSRGRSRASKTFRDSSSWLKPSGPASFAALKRAERRRPTSTKSLKWPA